MTRPNLIDASNNTETTDGSLLLPGLDGTNPLGFLAALGTLQSLHRAGYRPKLAWRLFQGSQWRAAISTKEPLSPDQMLKAILRVLHYGESEAPLAAIRHRLRFKRGEQARDRIERSLKKRKVPKELIKQKKEELDDLVEASRLAWGQLSHPSLMIGENTNIEAAKFREYLQQAEQNGSAAKRLTADLLVGLGIESPDDRGQMQDTALRTMSGSGHQHFLRFSSNLLAQVTSEHLEKALFRNWEYSDPIRNLTLRIDPIEDARYALQWDNPSTDSTRADSGSVLGANALAVLGLSLIPTVPTEKGAVTAGFIGHHANNTFWRWPLWTPALCVDTTRALLTRPELRTTKLTDHHSEGTSESASMLAPGFRTGNIEERLHAMGVALVCQSQRLTIGKFRNFTPAQRIA